MQWYNVAHESEMFMQQNTLVGVLLGNAECSNIVINMVGKIYLTKMVIQLKTIMQMVKMQS